MMLGSSRGSGLPGTHVRIVTRNGLELTGDRLGSDPEGVRIFDVAIRDVIQIPHEDVVEILAVDKDRSEALSVQPRGANGRD